MRKAGQPNLQREELDTVLDKLVPEFRELFGQWNLEYSTQERDLGAIGEMVNLWRKVKKVKAAVLDGADTSGWREPLRIVLLEVIAHAFLLLFDLDKQQERQDPPSDSSREYMPEEKPVKVPECGHIRCIEHLPVRISMLDEIAHGIYLQELREAQNGYVPPTPKELEGH